MREVQLKRIAALCFGFMLLVIGTAVFCGQETGKTVLATDSEELTQNSAEYDEYKINGTVSASGSGEAVDTASGPALIYTYQLVTAGIPDVDVVRWNELKNNLSADMQLLIGGIGDGADVSIEDIYMDNSIRITVDNYNQEAYDINHFQRVINGYYYIGEPDKNDVNDVVKKVSAKVVSSDRYEGSNRIIMDVKLNHIYAYEIKQYTDVCCIEVKNPHEVYDNIIVVDAGHGGQDNGCSTVSGRYLEKKFTLNITKRLKKKLDKANVKVYYTRLDDTGLALRQRVNLANELNADMFISIHCNYYDRYWVSGVNGIETLYSTVCNEHKKDSRMLAERLLDAAAASTGMRKRDVINRKKELYVLRESLVPAAIIETGYMSDSGDLKFFTNSRKTKKLVEGIYNGIVDAYRDIYGIIIH